MKWLEIIELRSVEKNRELLQAELKKLINEVDNEARKEAVLVYHRIMLDTDFSIHLLHDSKNVENSGSPLGLHIVSSLKSYGLVNHSIWVEMVCKEGN